LDEGSDLDPTCQSTLLDFFADVERMTRDERPGARLICATRHDLQERMRSGHFRDELFYRLHGVCLHVPPLRHRREDIPALLDFFLRKSAARLGRAQPTLSSWTMRLLLDHTWPGNVRELEEAMEKIVASGDEALALAALHRAGQDLSRPDRPQMTISLKEAARAASRRAERELMSKVLTRTRWNRKVAAKELQISYKALLYKLKHLGLEEDSASS
jgi:two-component system response regulator AtoC